jgi:hypothetical protein
MYFPEARASLPQLSTYCAATKRVAVSIIRHPPFAIRHPPFAIPNSAFAISPVDN